MSFVTASLAIAGVIAASIPIIVHLMSRQRRKPIEWAAMRFLLEALRKHRRRLRTEQLLLLAVRCLIVILFGAALARPLLTQAGILHAADERVVYLLIDNGMIAGTTDELGRTALEANAQQAISIIRSLQPGDRVSIGTAARPARLAVWPPTTDHGSAMNYIESLRPLDAPTDIPAALRALRPALEEHDAQGAHVIVYLLSDFRAGAASIESSLPQIYGELSDRVTFFAAAPSQQPAANVQITSVDPVRYVVLPGAADGSGQITVRLERHGGSLDRDATRVRLSGEGITRTEPRTVRWEPGQSQASVDFLVSFASSGRRIEPPNQADERAPGASASSDAAASRELAVTASIDDDALTADNDRHAIIELRDRLRVAMLDRHGFGVEPTIEGFHSGQWIRRALEPFDESPVQILDVEPGAVSMADVRTADVVMAVRPDLVTDAGWRVLRQYVDRGGVLLVMPPDELNIHPWAERFTHAMDLPWRIAAETQRHEGGLPLAPEQPTSAVLRLIASEMEDLARPVSAQRTLPVEAESSEPLLLFADGRPMLIAGTPGRSKLTTDGAEGTENELDASRQDGGSAHAPSSASTVATQSRGMVLYLASAPQLEWTNLPGKPLMVPLMHEIVRQSVGSVRAAQRAVAGDRPVIAPAGSAREMLEAKPRERGGEPMRIGLDEDGRPIEPLTRAGIFQVRDGAGQPMRTIAVNVDPRAGRTESLAAPSVLAWLDGAFEAVSGRWSLFDRDDPLAMFRAAEGASPIAWILLWIVLGLVAVETVLQRWFSHAESSGTIDMHRAKPPAVVGGVT